MRRPPKRWTALVATAALASALLGAASASAESGGPPAAPAPEVLAPIDLSAGTPPTTGGVSSAIGSLAARSLKGGSVIVVDPVTGTVLFSQLPDRPRIPASTAKLATAAAALNVLGTTTRIPTIAYRFGDTVYLVGGGDPTLVRAGGGNPLAGGSASLRDLAKSSVTGFTANSTVRLVYDSSAFTGPRLGPGWSRSFPSAGVAAPVTALVVDGGRVRPGANSRVSDPAKQAASVFAGYLRSQGLDVASVRPGPLHEKATEVARVESPPVADIVQRMLTESENNFAEAMAHLTGAKLLNKPTFEGGAEATEKELADLGIDVSGLSLADGSGLSGQNKVPARLLAAVLSDVVMAVDPDLAPIGPGLAVAGLTGTLAGRFNTAATRPGRGVVHAKTGTLTGVTSLAGTVLDVDGRVLVFALMANNVKSLASARDTMDRIASRLATCGCN